MKMEILKFNPCEEAQDFRARFENFEDAWNACDRGDWMLWIAKRLDVDLKLLTKAKAKCALTVRHLMKDERSIRACEVAILFSDDLATRHELDAYAYAYAAAAAKLKNRKETADICRQILTEEVFRLVKLLA